MLDPLPKDGDDVSVRDGIADDLSLPPEPDKASGTKDLKLMRNGGVRHAEAVGQIQNSLFTVDQFTKDQYSRLIRKNPKKICERSQVFTFRAKESGSVHR